MISSNEYAVTERQTQLHISMKHIRLESCSAPYKLKAHTTLQQVVVVAQHSRGEVCCACLSTTELIGVFCSAHQIDHDLHLLRHDIHCHAAVASARFQNSVTSNSGLIAQSCQSCRIGQRYRTIVWTPFWPSRFEGGTSTGPSSFVWASLSTSCLPRFARTSREMHNVFIKYFAATSPIQWQVRRSANDHHKE